MPLSTEGADTFPNATLESTLESETGDDSDRPHFFIFGSHSFNSEKLVKQIQEVHPLSGIVSGVTLQADVLEENDNGKVFVGSQVLEHGAVGLALPSPDATFLAELTQATFGDVRWKNLYFYEDLANLLFDVRKDAKPVRKANSSSPSMDINILNAIEALDARASSVTEVEMDKVVVGDDDDDDDDDRDYEKELEELWEADEDYNFEDDITQDGSIIFERFDKEDCSQEKNLQNSESISLNLIKVKVPESAVGSKAPVLFPGYQETLVLSEHKDLIALKESVESDFQLAIEIDVNSENTTTTTANTSIASLVQVINVEKVNDQYFVTLQGEKVVSIDREWYKPISFGALAAQASVLREDVEETKSNVKAIRKEIYEIVKDKEKGWLQTPIPDDINTDAFSDSNFSNWLGSSLPATAASKLAWLQEPNVTQRLLLQRNFVVGKEVQ
eukprot:g2557.t1